MPEESYRHPHDPKHIWDVAKAQEQLMVLF